MYISVTLVACISYFEDGGTGSPKLPSPKLHGWPHTSKDLGLVVVMRVLRVTGQNPL